MFGLIRRISYSVIPRPDRPWEDDRMLTISAEGTRSDLQRVFIATSNAPHKGKKRRMSASEEPEPDMQQANQKKVRGESSTPSVADSSEVHDRLSTPVPQAETKEVKEVTQGVKDVELEVGSAPESVPLPDEESDDLEESSSNVTPPPDTQSQNDVGVDESASDDQASHQDQSEASDETAIAEKGTTSEKGKEGQETTPVVVEGDAHVPDVTAIVAKSEPTRKLRSKNKADASTAKA
jgi:hypothetical protein